MNPFAMFAAQHAELLNRKRIPAPHLNARLGARPDTPTETAALDHIKANPGTDAKRIARAINIDPEQVYPIVQRLKRNGQIESTGQIGNGKLWRAVGC
jgi:DNA-binding MarR family transcriptional regulator